MGVYDLASNSWSTIANPLASGTADITATGGEIYMAEGEGFVKYNPATETETVLANPPSFAPSGCSTSGFASHRGGLQPYQGKVYGHQGDGCKGFGVYDIASNSWSELSEVPGKFGPETPAWH